MKTLPTMIVILVLAVLVLLSAGVEAAGDGRRRSTSAYGIQKRPLVDHGTTLNIYGPGGDRLAWTDEVATYVPVGDHLSSVRLVVSGETISYEYGPYGAAMTSTPGSTYAGHPYDAQRSLYETPSRPYDPNLGRFLSLDTTPGEAGPYSYAGLNPIVNLDPGGNIEIPFFIRSGFAIDPSINSSQSPLAISIAVAVAGPPRGMLRDESLFNYTEGIPAASRFRSIGRQSIRVNPDSNSYRHNEIVYWLVGNDDEVSVRKPLDAAEVFAEWRSLRPGIASKVVIIDTSGASNRSQPIQEALRGAGIRYAVVGADVRSSPVNQSGRARVLANSFVVGDGLMNRDGFSRYVHSIAGALQPQSPDLTRLMPPPDQIRARLQQPPPAGESFVRGLSLSEMYEIARRPPVRPVQIPSSNWPPPHERNPQFGSDPMLWSTATEDIPVIVPAPLDSINPEATIRY